MKNLSLLPLSLGLFVYTSMAIDLNFSSSHPSVKAVFKQPVWTKLIGGFAGCEGAQWVDVEGKPTLFFAAHHDLNVFTWSEKEGLLLFKSNSPEATSFRPDQDQNLIVVEQMTRQVSKWNLKGETVEVLVKDFEGKRINRPNDARIDAMGCIWFTDPDFLFSKRPQEVKEADGQYVYCYDPKTKIISAPIRNLVLPNGIAIAPDGKTLYVGDSKSASVYHYHIKSASEVEDKGLFYKHKDRRVDGLSFDLQGNLWLAGKDAIHQIDGHGKWLGQLDVPGNVTSMDFHPSGWVAITTTEACYVSRQ